VTTPSLQELRAARVRLPQHVVHRAFVEETVVLNLRTGKYHGLNPTAGRMLEVLGESPTVADAIAALAAEYGVEAERIERDVAELCGGLLERGLIEIDDGDAG
jgi:PqqD family protein of HPr-rel-A system